jgi:hypothetical protein
MEKRWRNLKYAATVAAGLAAGDREVPHLEHVVQE